MKLTDEEREALQLAYLAMDEQDNVHEALFAAAISHERARAAKVCRDHAKTLLFNAYVNRAEEVRKVAAIIERGE